MHSTNRHIFRLILPTALGDSLHSASLLPTNNEVFGVVLFTALFSGPSPTTSAILALRLSISKVNGLGARLAAASQALIILYELREVAGIDTGAPLLPNSAGFDRCDCHWLLQVGHTQRHRPYTDIHRPRICVVDNGAYESHI